MDGPNSDLDDVLEHFGVKGMKWGQRKAGEASGAPSRRVVKGDQKFEKAANDPKTVFKVYNRAADLTNKNDVHRINNKPEYKDQDFLKDTPLRRKYYAEHQRAFLDNLEKAAQEIAPNPSGTRHYTIMEDGNGGWEIVTKEVKK